MSRRASAALLGSLLLHTALCGGPAVAQQPSADGLVDPDPDAEYWDAVHRALSEYKAGRWSEARAAFQDAHTLRPSARTYRGLGLTAYELRDYVAAIRALRQAQQERRSPLTSDQRQEAANLERRAQTYVGKLRVKTTPPQVEIRVNGHTAQPDEGWLLLNPGTHQLTFDANGYRTAARTVELQAGDELALQVALVPEATALVAGPAPAPTESTRTRASGPPTESAPLLPTPQVMVPPVHDEAPGAGQAWAWVALGSSAVLAGTAGALWLEGNDRLDGIAAACRRDGCDRAERDRRVDDRNLSFYETTTSVAVGLSIGALIAGVTLYFSETSGNDDVRVSLSPTGARVGWSL